MHTANNTQKHIDTDPKIYKKKNKSNEQIIIIMEKLLHQSAFIYTRKKLLYLYVLKNT